MVVCGHICKWAMGGRAVMLIFETFNYTTCTFCWQCFISCGDTHWLTWCYLLLIESNITHVNLEKRSKSLLSGSVVVGATCWKTIWEIQCNGGIFGVFVTRRIDRTCLGSLFFCVECRGVPDRWQLNAFHQTKEVFLLSLYRTGISSSLQHVYLHHPSTFSEAFNELEYSNLIVS